MRRILLPLLLLAVSGGLAAAPAPPAPPAARPAPGLPPGVHPLPEKLARRMEKLVQAAESARGRRLLRPVPYGALDQKGLEGKVAETLAEDLPPGEMRALEVSLLAFGLLPEGGSAEKVYKGLLGQQVVAFYDPDRKYLALVERQESAAEAGRSLGPDLARRMEEGIVVHELTHAIDDQSFDLSRMKKSDPMSDGGAAYLGLVEGDATLTMFDFIQGKRVEEIPGFGRMMADWMKDPAQLAALSSDLPGSAGLANAPAWFRDTLAFSYLQGLSFCVEVARRGGSKLIDYAFQKDPPRSTEQILHPEKWLGRRDDPIELAWPDLSALLPGWKKAAEGQMGEEGVLILLRQALPAAEATTTAPNAAAGWGGDRFAVYEKEGRRLLLWLTEWDSAADATEIETAAARLGAGWKALRSSPTRVVLLRGAEGSLPAEALARVESSLGEVPAVRPANRAIDYAALGLPPAP